LIQRIIRAITAKKRAANRTGDAMNPHSYDRERRTRYGLFVLVGLAILTVLAALTLLLVRPAQLPMPHWAVNLVEMQVNRALGSDTVVSVDGAAIALPRQGTPFALTLDHVVVRSVRSGVEVTLPRARLSRQSQARAATADPSPRTYRLAIDGARLMVRRGAGGDVALALVDELGRASPELGAATVIGLAEELVRVLGQPGLDRLSALEIRDATLFYEDARLGRLWEMGAVAATVARAGDRLTLELDALLVQPGDRPAQVTATADHRIGAARIEAGVSFADLSLAQLPGQLGVPGVTGWLSGEVSARLGPDGPESVLEAGIALRDGAVALGPGRSLALPLVHAQLQFDPATRQTTLVDLAVQGDQINADLQGTAWPAADGTWVAQLAFDRVVIDTPDMLADRVHLTGGADLRFDPADRRLDIGQLWVSSDAKASVIRATGTVAAGPAGPVVAVDFRSPAIRHDTLLALWPIGYQRASRMWLAENLREAMFRQVAGGLRLEAGQRPRFALSFDVTEMRLHPLRRLPAIEAGQGHGLVTSGAISLLLTGGQMPFPGKGAVDLAGSRFAIPDIAQKPARGIADITASGGLAAALALLDHPPFGFLTKAGFDPGLGSGQARATARVAFPITRGLGFDKIDLTAQGQVSGFRSETLIPDRSLEADRLEITADAAAVTVSGALTLDGLPVTAAWRKPLGRGSSGSQVTGAVELSQRFLDTFGIALPPGSIDGRGWAELTLDLPEAAPPRFALQSDLDGVGLRLAALGWSVGASTLGALEAEGILGQQPRIERLVLDAPGLLAEGRVRLRPGGVLEAAEFDRIRRGDWLSAAVTLTGRGPGNPVGVAVNGGSLDLRRAEFGSGGGAGRTGRSAA
jgi:hypothetical protein